MSGRRCHLHLVAPQASHTSHPRCGHVSTILCVSNGATRVCGLGPPLRAPASRRLGLPGTPPAQADCVTGFEHQGQGRESLGDHCPVGSSGPWSGVGDSCTVGTVEQRTPCPLPRWRNRVTPGAQSEWEAGLECRCQPCAPCSGPGALPAPSCLLQPPRFHCLGLGTWTVGLSLSAVGSGLRALGRPFWTQWPRSLLNK